MNARYRSLMTCLAFAAVALTTLPASAKYAPPPVHDVFGISDLVVVGEISALQAETFDLKVEEMVVGEPAETIRIQRFQNWTCAHRWAPYKKGQKLLVFASKAKDGKWHIRSAGGEGEMPIIGKNVVLRGYYALEGSEAGTHETPGGKAYGMLLPLATVVDAVKGYREHFEVTRITKPYPKAGAVKPLRSPAEVKAFADRSPLHALLARAGR